MPIYHVKTPSGATLVCANTKAQAIGHIIRTTITAETVTASEVVTLMQNGVAVEAASTPEPAPEPPQNSAQAE